MAQPGRREAVVKMVNDLKKRGIRIDAIGMQGHIGMDYPKISEFEKSTFPASTITSPVCPCVIA